MLFIRTPPKREWHRKIENRKIKCVCVVCVFIIRKMIKQGSTNTRKIKKHF